MGSFSIGTRTYWVRFIDEVRSRAA